MFIGLLIKHYLLWGECCFLRPTHVRLAAYRVYLANDTIIVWPSRAYRPTNQQSVSWPKVKRFTWRDADSFSCPYGCTASRYRFYTNRTVGNPISSANNSRFSHFVTNENSYGTMSVCLPPPPAFPLITINWQLRSMHETLYEHLASTGYTNFVLSKSVPNLSEHLSRSLNQSDHVSVKHLEEAWTEFRETR